MKTTSKWYALYVASGQELEVACAIGRLAWCEASAPLVKYDYRGAWRIEPLFGGYVFVHCDLTPTLYYQLIDIKGVIRILGVMPGGQLPEAIPDQDMWWIDTLKAYSLTSMVIGESEGKRGANGRVEITSGFLKEIPQYITKINARQHYAVVELPVGGTVHKLRFGINVNSN